MYKGFQLNSFSVKRSPFAVTFTESLAVQGFQVMRAEHQCPSGFQRNISKICDYQNEFTKLSTLNSQLPSATGN